MDLQSTSFDRSDIYPYYLNQFIYGIYKLYIYNFYIKKAFMPKKSVLEREKKRIKLYQLYNLRNKLEILISMY